jgi:hypothetical protein
MVGTLAYHGGVIAGAPPRGLPRNAHRWRRRSNRRRRHAAGRLVNVVGCCGTCGARGKCGKIVSCALSVLLCGHACNVAEKSCAPC